MHVATTAFWFLYLFVALRFGVALYTTGEGDASEVGPRINPRRGVGNGPLYNRLRAGPFTPDQWLHACCGWAARL